MAEEKADHTRLTHKQAVNRLKDIRDDCERIAAKESRTSEDDRTFAEAVAEADVLDEHVRNLERQADLDRVRAIVKDPSKGRIESGDGAAPADPARDKVLNPDSVRERRFRNPWDLSEMRSGLTPMQQGSEIRSRALAAIEKMPATEDPRREVMTRFIERFDTRDARLSWLALATSSEAYVRAFGKLLGAQGDKSILDDDEQKAVVRAMSLTDNAGGYLVPFQLDPSVINTASGSFNQVRQVARQVIATGDVWNGVSSAGVTGSWDAEAAEVSDDAPTLAQPTVPIHKLAIFVPISIEALQDAQNVAAEVGEMIAFEKDRLESVAFLTGSGSGQPTGIVTALTGGSSVIASATADTFAAADVYAVDSGLPARHRVRASWLAHRAIYNRIRQFDTSGGSQMWERIGADVPAQLLGKGAYEGEAMDSSITALADNLVLLFGDFQRYVIADRIGTQVEFIPHLFHTTTNRPSGSRGWYAYARVGADSVDDGAFRLLNVT
jgi:HK97 family phage major capsid protein